MNIKQAGLELVKGNFGTAVKSLLYGTAYQPVMNVNPDDYRGGFTDGMFFFGNDGKDYYFKYNNGHKSSLLAYQQCPPLTSIINRKAQADINGKRYVMNTQGKESNSPEAKKIRALFKKPNHIQSEKRFRAQQKIYMQIFGFCITLPIIPAGYEKYGALEATSLWNIPPYMLDIKETNKLFYQTDMKGIIDQITLNYKGEKTKLDINNLYFFEDFTPSMCSLVIPETRICSLAMPINNVIGAYDSRNALINTRGALGIISPESADGAGISIPMKPSDKEQLQADFRRYGIRNGQWKMILSNAAVKWSQISIPTKDLMLNEEVTECSKEICNGFGYPPFLLGLADTTYSNQESAGKGLYQNTIIPEAESMDEEWNNMFKTEDYNLKIETDYSHLPVLQEDKQKLATARKTLGEELRAEFYANLITYNRVLELLGEDTRSGFDKYYTDLIKEGISFVLPQTQQNGNQSQTDGQSGGTQGG